LWNSPGAIPTPGIEDLVASDLVSLKRRSSPHSSSASALPRLGLGISLDHDIDHGALEDLTRRALGKLFPNLDVLWNFEACDPVFTKVLERLRTGIGARLQADHRLDAVAPHLVRDAEHRDLMDGWMLGELILDPGRKDVVAAALDAKFDTIGEVDVSLPIAACKVAGAQPFAEEHLLRLLRGAPVAGKYHVAAHHQLADLAERNVLVLLINDPCIYPRQGSANRSQQLGARGQPELVIGRKQHIGHAQQLGRAVHLQKWTAELHERLADGRRRQRRGAVTQKLHRTYVVFVEARHGQQRG